MEFRAEARYLRVSPQKARLVLDLIKGRRVEEARNTLHVHEEARGGDMSASCCSRQSTTRTFSRAEKGLDVDIDNLYVKHAVANDGPRMKRIRPAPKGRAYRYLRRIAHIELVLAERGQNGEAVTVGGAEDSCGSHEDAAARTSGEEGQQEESGSKVDFERGRAARAHGSEV